MNIDDSIRDGLTGLAALGDGDGATAADRAAVEQRARGLQRRRTTARVAGVLAIVLVIVALAVRPVPTTVDSAPAGISPAGTDPSGPVGTAPGTIASPSTTVAPPARAPLPVEPFQAEPATATCRLIPRSADLSDLPMASATWDPRGSYGKTVRAAEGSIDARGPAVYKAEDRLGSLFVVEKTVVVSYDPATARPAWAVRLQGSGCTLSGATGTSESLAATACADDGSGGSPPCHLVLRVGGHTRSWATPPSTMGLHLTWDDGQVVVAGDGWAARVDPLTGAGTIIRSTSACATPAVTLIPNTRLAIRACNGINFGERADVIDVADGAVLETEFPAKFLSLHSDGDVIWGDDFPRRDADTFAELGPSALPPALLDQLFPNGPNLDRLVGLIEVPGGLWLQRCVGSCTGGDGTIEFVHMELPSGNVTDRWTATETLVSRETRPSSIQLRAADPTGAWYTVNGRLYRLNRPSG